MRVGYLLATTSRYSRPSSHLALPVVKPQPPLRPGADAPSPFPGGQLLTASLQKITVKSTVLYEGPFEFSYAEERTRIDLNDGTSLRINQYRPLAEIALEVPEQDVLKDPAHCQE